MTILKYQCMYAIVDLAWSMIRCDGSRSQGSTDRFRQKVPVDQGFERQTRRYRVGTTPHGLSKCASDGEREARQGESIPKDTL